MKRTRGKNFKEADRDLIRTLSSQGYSVRRIASIMNRGKSGVQLQLDKMRSDGSITQGVMDLGQFDEE